jgi:hypothetical protein
MNQFLNISSLPLPWRSFCTWRLNHLPIQRECVGQLRQPLMKLPEVANSSFQVINTA